MDTFEAIEKRASVRRFADEPVSKQQILKVLDAARRAPSGHNAQPWQFIVVTDKRLIEELSVIQNCIAQAPAVIGIILDAGKSRFWLEDGAAAIENISLAATALGLGTCWIEGNLLPREEEVKQILDIPEHLRLLALLPLGVPSGSPKQARKKDLGQIVHWNRYGGTESSGIAKI